MNDGWTGADRGEKTKVEGQGHGENASAGIDERRKYKNALGDEHKHNESERDIVCGLNARDIPHQ